MGKERETANLPQSLHDFTALSRTLPKNVMDKSVKYSKNPFITYFY